MALENQKLLSENFQNRFNSLAAQLNPHFFFNSLNSLASLIREKNYRSSLTYINELSDIFRYVLKSDPKELVLLSEEISFLNAYQYMLGIRFENKLFFEVEVDNYFQDNFLLPALSLQPVIENVVKHNIICDDQPMTIKIFVSEYDWLHIVNPIQKKEYVEKGPGIGMENLNNRYLLLVGKGIKVNKGDKVFEVKLPLLKLQYKQSEDGSNNH
jgi:LytS/YehU family sensor histidine kinase